MVAPLASILIPCFNASAYLAECIESALAQSYSNIEVIVVDDGSTDDSVRIAGRFVDPRVKVLEQENKGQPAALNAAYRHSCGDYLQYLDADDLLHPNKIEIQIHRLQFAPDAIATGAWAKFGRHIADATFVPEVVWKDLSPEDWLVSAWSTGAMMHVGGWLVPRRTVDKAGPWPEALRWAANIDSHFFTRTLLASSRALFCADAMSYYRSGHVSHRSLRTRRSFEASLQVILDDGNALLKSENTPRTRSAFADNLQRYVYAAYPEVRDLVSSAEAQIHELGGSRLAYIAGPWTRRLSKVVGWKAARQLRRMAVLR